MNRVRDVISTFPVASGPKTTDVVLFVRGGSERYELERLSTELETGRSCGEHGPSTVGRGCRADVLWLDDGQS